MVVLLLTIAVSAFSLFEVQRSIAYGDSIDATKTTLWLALGGLLDQDQGVNGLTEGRSAYFSEHFKGGREAYSRAFSEVDNFVQLRNMSKAGKAAEKAESTYTAWLKNVALPIVAGTASNPRSLQVKGQLQIDDIQQDFSVLQQELENAAARRETASKAKVAVAAVFLVAMSTAFAIFAILADGRRRRDETRSAAMLARRSAELERSNTALQDFAYVASHDLQEPLRMVASYTQLLGKRYSGKLDADADEFIAFAVDGAKRMQSLISDVLAYSSVTSGGQPLVSIAIDEVVSSAAGNLRMAIKETGATLDAAPRVRVLGDHAQLVQLFQNLIGNALKYRKPHGAPHIRMSSEVDGEMYRFEVRDNGIGIAPEHSDRIFRMFQRLHSAQEYAGTGIGLTLCKRIVERHGGSIWVDSSPGNGSAFRFTLMAA